MVDGKGTAWRIRLTAEAAAIPLLEAALSGFGEASASGVADAGGKATLDVYCPEAPPRKGVAAQVAVAAAAAGIAAPAFEIERLPDVDWVAEGRKALPAVQAGPFYIFGSHVEAEPPPGAIPLRLEASVAFGTGRHETTRGCLMALAALKACREVGCALDLGCGSGILALAAAKLWGCQVVAVDNDPDAVRLTRENAAANGESLRVQAYEGEGYACSAAGTVAPFDLIVANILAGPLIKMAADLKLHLAPGGTAVLSGLTPDQAEAVLEAHRPLRLKGDYPMEGWTTLVLE